MSLPLPEEIIEVILVRVEGTALLKFRCVSKSWRCLIDSKRFRNSQLENSRKNACIRGHVVIENPFSYVVHPCRVQSFLNGSCLEACLDRMNKSWLGCADMVGSFNGLVCLVQRGRYFIMGNLCTRIFKRLPVLDCFWQHLERFGMGWFESRNEYKIFAGSNFGARVYSSKTNSWNQIMPYYKSNFKCMEKMGLFLSGKLHWVKVGGYGDGGDDEVVVSLDLESEVYGLIELPFKQRKCGYGRHLVLGELGGCLCVIQALIYKPSDYRWRSVDVWVMKEYGVKESWQKFEPPFPASASASASTVVCEKGEVVVFFGSAILVYYPKENVFHHCHLDNQQYPLRMIHSMDTLVSPDIVSLI